MTFEGQQVNIPIKGIMRAGTDNLCADGAMNEVIGLEYKDGSWKPYMMSDDGAIFRDIDIELDGAIEKAYVHKTSDNSSHYIFLTTNRSLYYETSRTSAHRILATQLVTDVKDVEFVGNTLCVATETGMKYYLWKEGTYEEKRNELDEIGGVSLRVTNGYEKEGDMIIGMAYRSDFVESPAGTFNWSTYYNHCRELVQSDVIAAIGALTERGGLTGYVIGCVAYRKKNGDIIAASAPVLLAPPMAKFNSSDDGYRESRWDGTELTDTFPKIGGGTMELYQKSPNQDKTYHCVINGSGISVGENNIRLASNNGQNYCLPLIHMQCVKGHDAVYQDPNALILYSEDVQVPELLSTVEVNSQADSDGNRTWKTFAYVAANGLQYKIKDSQTIAALKANDIQSICFFITDQVSPFRIKSNIGDFDKMFIDNTGSRPIYIKTGDNSYSASTNFCLANTVSRKSDNELIEEIKRLGSLYLVKELVVEDNLATGTWEPIDLSGNLGDNLLVREQMPLTAFEHTKTIPEHIDSYNFRLHEFDYKQELFKGYAYPQFAYHGGEGQHASYTLPHTDSDYYYTYKWEIRVTLKDENGVTKVVNYDNNAIESIVDSLTPFITYPSLDAQSMDIRLLRFRNPAYTYGTLIYSKHIDFSHDSQLGLSYYLEPELKPIIIISTGTESTTNVPTYQEENTTRYYANGLKVSDVAYPSYFPAAYTYRIGNERIVDIARFTMPVSQDQYGGYALVIFCTDGIYTMDVDTTGNGVYSNIRFFSPEVCVNRNTICEIGGAVIFASDKGLMILSADGVQEFTPHLNGEIRFAPESTGTTIKDGQHIYNKMVTNNQLTELKTSLSTDDFIDYLHADDTIASYVSKKKAIVVYRKSKPYIYLIDIATRNTTKLDIQLEFDDDNSPEETYWSEKSGVYSPHTFEYRSKEGATDCLIESRPITIQQDDKCSFRLVITGYLEGAENSTKWAGLVVLGSLDAKNWQVIGVENKQLNKPFHNIGCLTNRGSWKYIKFIFAANLSENSHIDSIDITVEGKYNNKKR